MKVEVVHASHTAIHVLTVEIGAGATVEQAILASGLLALEPQLALGAARVGIWNRVVRLGTLLREGDRVEVYRPLVVDPKEARRIRAAVRQRKKAR